MGETAGDFELTLDELRAVVRFVIDSARPVLPLYETAVPTDPRPRDALTAAELFASGAPRTGLQRRTAVEAHRAAAEAPDEVAQLAARACGDAAAAAYLHPLAKPTQVGHILRAAACAARIAEVRDGCGSAAVDASLRETRARCGPVVAEVLLRYPSALTGSGRLAQLMSEIDTDIRSGS